MQIRRVMTGSIVAAILAAACCLGPLLLLGLGLSAAAASWFAPLRPYFLAASIVLLAVAFYLAYRRPRSAGNDASCCELPDSARRTRLGLWIAAAVVALFAFFPLYGARLLTPHSAGKAPAPAPLAEAHLHIDGMDCAACAAIIQQKLLATAGVASAEVHFPAGDAIVRYSPDRVHAPDLVKAVNAVGYRATVIGVRGDAPASPDSGVPTTQSNGGQP